MQRVLFIACSNQICCLSKKYEYGTLSGLRCLWNPFSYQAAIHKAQLFNYLCLFIYTFDWCKL